MTYQIQTYNKIADAGLKLLDEQYKINESNEPDAILLRSHKLHNQPIPNSVQAIARAGAGTNNIPIEQCSEQGVVVFNTPGANANAVKELVISCLIASSRNLFRAVQWTHSLKGETEIPEKVEANKKAFIGHEVAGKKLGVIGLGNIGSVVANDALALDMEVMAYDPFVSVDVAWTISRSVKRVHQLEELLAQCDFITIHVPLSPKTTGIIDEKAFKAMKKGIHFINFARGELVDHAALKKALEDGTVGKYITDFPSDDIFGMDNVVATPHLGASTTESEENCAVMAARQLKNYLETGNIKNAVNLPNVSLPLTSPGRLTIMHRNIPNMLGQFSQLLAERNFNIADMLNRSRGEFAYTLIDIDNKLNDEEAADIMNRFQKIEGVIRARHIANGWH
ncbi:phosphoglycerate dehydrogenase [Jeotgalibacillus haloalkalitolerans]|uniref:D-3-phosphoglycerate dehydrogenase n=1 Tax=Jeotgalibacillus haloalkalitolerans TaxID=3104292 RepID=A0ABU5KJD6_9BACL|nr:phosphoglycerate dehydrogenase [Jeotgalibacillus sp. HH7-29]MDZ5711287.1 phosphoglycerate dehydrogenase [Jeotgalibacillus sp. HH7-29]